MQIAFKKANIEIEKTIFNWLEEPHVKEFWDNSQAHKDDIIKFINGRKQPSTYANGKYSYWVAFTDNVPYSLIMIIKEDLGEDRPQIKEDHLSTTGNTYSIDFMIGNPDFLGKGLGAKTLEAFTNFYQKTIDPVADTFFIDPDIDNPRAKHVYSQAGFQYVGDFIMEGAGVFSGHKTAFLVKKLIS